LDLLLDKRLVRTFLHTIAVILTFRDRANGLLLSELGGDLASAAHAPAGTKRLSNRFHSAKWRARLLTDFLWQRASQPVEQWQQAGQEGLLLWDESGWEKPESWQLEDLGPTRSSQAARLTHIKPGYYSPPRGPLFVPGWPCCACGGWQSAADREDRAGQARLVATLGLGCPAQSLGGGDGAGAARGASGAA
jgi:hypothetical protein